MKKRRFVYLLTGVVIGALAFGAVPAIAAGVTAVLSGQSVTLDGEPVQLTAYNIEGSNYTKLRDIGAILDVGVWYDEAEKTVRIESDKPYDPDYAGPGSTVELGRIYIADYYDAHGGFSALGLALPLDGTSSETVLTVKAGDVIIVGGGQYKVAEESVTISFYTQPTLDGVIVWWTDYMDTWQDNGGVIKLK